MGTKPFRRYWAITPDGLGLVINEDHSAPIPDALVQVDNRTRWYYLERIRPATFSEYCWRDDGFAGVHYGLFFTVFVFCLLLLFFGTFAGSMFPELWGRITCILAGPVIMGTWVGATYMNFKRYWV